MAVKRLSKIPLCNDFCIFKFQTLLINIEILSGILHFPDKSKVYHVPYYLLLKLSWTFPPLSFLKWIKLFNQADINIDEVLLLFFVKIIS